MNWFEILELIGKSRQVLIKKLSRNDCSWADDSGKHQNGIYIPEGIRQSGFLPPLININPDKPHILEAQFKTLWPSTGELKLSNLKHYSNKGSELHFTRVPKEEFADLTPASLLLGGIFKNSINDAAHWFLVLDSACEEAELLESLFDLDSEFHCSLFDPATAFKEPLNETDALIGEMISALKADTLDKFIAVAAKLPTPAHMASAAQSEYLRAHELTNLDPYAIPNPGDAIMKISRDIEYSIYKRVERRHRAAEVLRILSVENGLKGGESLVNAVVRGYPALDATFLSASQHRKSRAGRSFEHHIFRLLTDGKIPFDEQAVTGGRRPDFVLPSLKWLNAVDRDFNGAVILSAKTTLRERWKQVTLEKFNCGLFLATVDDRISASAIDDMGTHGVTLVVPESLKKSKDTCYDLKNNVITFADFFVNELATKREKFASAGKDKFKS
ncbi:MAG: type II restriction endonuclease [Pseudomonadota bacterium]